MSIEKSPESLPERKDNGPDQEDPQIAGEKPLRKILSDAATLQAYAAETGLKLKEESIGAIEAARDAFTHGKWTPQIARQFWPAYGELCTAVKPVTAESLVPPSRLDVWLYRLGSFASAALILVASLYTVINTSVSKDIDEHIKSNDAVEVDLGKQVPASTGVPNQNRAPPPAGFALGTDRLESERKAVNLLQQLADTNRLLYDRTTYLNQFIFNTEPDPLKVVPDKKTLFEVPSTFTDVSAASSDQIKNYHKLQAYAKNVQQLYVTFSGVLISNVLPILYALLGACVYGLRSISVRAHDKTYISYTSAGARITIAGIAGLMVGLLSNLTQGISLSPVAVAFLLGYSVETFFVILDALLETLKKVRK
jgi:hypothetical protein